MSGQFSLYVFAQLRALETRVGDNGNNYQIVTFEGTLPFGREDFGVQHDLKCQIGWHLGDSAADCAASDKYLMLRRDERSVSTDHGEKGFAGRVLIRNELQVKSDPEYGVLGEAIEFFIYGHDQCCRDLLACSAALRNTGFEFTFHCVSGLHGRRHFVHLRDLIRDRDEEYPMTTFDCAIAVPREKSRSTDKE